MFASDMVVKLLVHSVLNQNLLTVFHIIIINQRAPNVIRLNNWLKWALKRLSTRSDKINRKHTLVYYISMALDVYTRLVFFIIILISVQPTITDLLHYKNNMSFVIKIKLTYLYENLNNKWQQYMYLIKLNNIHLMRNTKSIWRPFQLLFWMFKVHIHVPLVNPIKQLMKPCYVYISLGQCHVAKLKPCEKKKTINNI